MKWISVKDKLPEYHSEADAYVLASLAKRGDFDANWYYVITSYNGKYWEHYDNPKKDIENNPDFMVVTHWMPLPDLPE